MTAEASTPSDRLAARLRRRLETEAARLGFSALGVTTPERVPDLAGDLEAFLAAGHHASMGWMTERTECRARPRGLWPEVRSIVVVAFDYGPRGDALAGLATPDRGVISAYARNRDYHDVVKGKLKELAGGLVGEARRAGVDGDVKVFVDTAPVMEKPLAAAAGIAWQGKNTLAVSRRIGGWFFLGVIYTTLELAPDAAERPHCGSCCACLDACPTDAFPAPHRLDARRCISYLTIEHAGPIPIEFRTAVANRIYGCDDCLAVCPWNKFAVAAREAKLVARPDLVDPPLADLVDLDDAAFRAHFAGSPIKRTGRDRFVRNVLIAIGNSRDPGFLPAIGRRLGDEAAVVRGAAVWAAGRLAGAAEAARLFDVHGRGETDPDVRAEWAALGLDRH
jgi:epoxyqueuosine reductase